MYESLVIGRSFMMYRVMFFKNIFFTDLAHRQEEHEQHTSAVQRLGRYSGGALTDWYTLASTKGEIIQRLQQVLRRSMDSGMILQRKRSSWFTLCPWCQRGRMIWYCCHQVQRGRLLALWDKCCPWWQTSLMTNHSTEGQQQGIDDQTIRRRESSYTQVR